MSVWVDHVRAPVKYPGKSVWYFNHMIADTRSELDAMAEAIELDPKYKQSVGEWNEHFDVTESYRDRAIKFGAKPVGVRTIVIRLQQRDLQYYLEH